MAAIRRAVEVYVTVGSRADADRLSRVVVTEKLAACVNVWPIRSTFRWGRSLRTRREFALLIKTTKDRYLSLERRIRALHHDEIPCIISWTPTEGFAPYLHWIDDMTHA